MTDEHCDFVICVNNAVIDQLNTQLTLTSEPIVMLRSHTISSIASSNFWTYLFCLVAFLPGCDSKNRTPPDVPKYAEHDASTAEDSVLKTLRISQVTNRIHGTGTKFNPALLNHVDRAPHYANSGSQGAKAANFGIYLSDLKYAATYGQQEAVKRYFEACIRLSESAGIKREFSQIVQYLPQEIMTEDSAFEKSVQRQLNNAQNTSEGEEFKKAHASSLAGYYIEELYHLVSFLQSYSKDQNSDEVFFTILNTLVSQKSELNALITYFDHIDMKPEGISAYQDLLYLQTIYLQLDIESPSLETEPSKVLGNKSLHELFAAILTVRNKIVNF